MILKMGLLLKEPTTVINANATGVFEEGKTYYVSVGVKDIPTKVGRKFAVMIGDTIVVTKGEANVLTDTVKKAREAVMISIQVPKPAANPNPKTRPGGMTTEGKGGSRLSNEHESPRSPHPGPAIQTRNQKRMLAAGGRGQSEELEKFRRFEDHQEKLLTDKQEEMRQRLKENLFVLPGVGKDTGSQLKLVDLKTISGPERLPKFGDKNKVHLDVLNNALWVPLEGQLQPFHVSVVKNLSVQHEGRTSLLRVNFNVPGRSNRQACEFPKDMSAPVYIQELSFKTASGKDHFENILVGFKRMQKEYRPAQLAGILETDEKLITSQERRPVLDDLLSRPPLSGKKSKGRLELHKNGFRFKSSKGEVLDILLSQVKHYFCLPCDQNDMILLHLHLLGPMIVGGKRVHDVQFYSVIDAGQMDLVESNDKRKRVSGRRSDDYDEVAYKKNLESLEANFDAFIDAVEKVSSVVFEVPDLELGFAASYNFSSETIYPTDTCLVSLIASPPLVVPLAEIELVVFERMGFINRSFDIAVIFKDYSKSVVTVSGVATSLKSRLKFWFDEKDIIVLEGNNSVQWQQVIRRVSVNLEQFIEDQGGWSFFAGDGSKEKSSAVKVAKKKKRSSGGRSREASNQVAGEGSGSEDYADEDDELSDGESMFEEDGSEESEGSLDSDEYSDDEKEDDESVIEFDDSEDDELADDDFEPDSQDSLVVKEKKGKARK